MPRPEPLTAAVVERVSDLLREGQGRNAAARMAGVSAGSVSKIARATGIEFSAAARTAQATLCARVDAASVRSRREAELLHEQGVALAAGEMKRVRQIEKRLVDLTRFAGPRVR